MKYCAVLFALFFTFQMSYGQQLTGDEKELYNLIMEYRKSKNLSSIPLSSSLTVVAQTHCKDLVDNRPDQGKCNAHSWSNKGKWTPCCYTSDHAQASCMWNKPKELTSYKYAGYEISCVGSNLLSPLKALETWQGSKGHNDVILNKGAWDSAWKAIGIGMYKGYATVWFGHVEE